MEPLIGSLLLDPMDHGPHIILQCNIGVHNIFVHTRIFDQGILCHPDYCTCRTLATHEEIGLLELTSETRIAEIQAESQAMMKALMSTGIFRAGDNPDVTIDGLCRNFGLDPLFIIGPLKKAWSTEVPSTIDISELDGMTLTQVVENIVVEHHAYLRETLPVIGALLERVVQAHGNSDSRLGELYELMDKMAADFESHMLHEEEALFPMVRDMEMDDGTIKPTRCGQAVAGPIMCMENDHNVVKEELLRVRKLTDDYAVPGFACMTYRNLLETLSQFDQNTVRHVHKEDEVLFPYALKAQKVLREGGQVPNVTL
jgi:regulator of cell morphogenesis and NO signaling